MPQNKKHPVPRKKKQRAAGARADTTASIAPRDLNEDAAVLSGDLQGLSDVPESDSQSVRELVEDGQFYEAQVVSGVENAPLAGARKVKTREVREDDVPPEYTDVDPDAPKEE